MDYEELESKCWMLEHENKKLRGLLERVSEIVVSHDVPAWRRLKADVHAALGKKLVALRKEAIAEGMELLSEDEVTNDTHG